MEVYQHIAEHFDDTRFCHWNAVKQFLHKLPSKSFILDAGCGNGKYLSVRNDLVFTSMDITRELLEISNNKRRNIESDTDYLQCSIDYNVFREEVFDAIISIAVIHHIKGYENRLNVIKQLINKLKKGGKLLIMVWAYEQEDTRKRDNKWKRINSNTTEYNVPWRDRKTGKIYDRYYNLFTEQEVDSILEQLKCTSKKSYEYSNWVIEISK